MHLLGQRLVLDQLHDVVLEHHLAPGHRQVAAQTESLAVGHAHLQLLAITARQILEQVVQPLDQVLAAGVDRLPQRLRIGQQEIRWRQRIDVLTGVEIDLFRRFVIESVNPGQRVMQVTGRNQIRLLDIVVEKIAFPVIVAKPPVGLVRLGDGRRNLTHHFQHRVLPQRQVVLPQLHLQFGHSHRVSEHLAPGIKKSLGDP